MRHALHAGLTLSATIALALPGAAGPARTDSYFGLNGTKITQAADPNDPAIRARINAMRELGVRWDRGDLWWGTVEPKRGVFDYSKTDRVFETLDQSGIHLFPILCYGASWFRGHTAPQTDRDFSDFANYAYRTVRHYRGRARYWEVWNEPNITAFWSPEPNAAMYARLLKLTYRAVKRADPNALVCAPALAPLGQWDRRFLEGIYQNGAGRSFDVFDYHYYRNDPPEAEVPGEIDEIRAVMRRYGAEKPIWISESGVSSIHQGRGGANERQAALVVRNQLLCLAMGVQRFFYFDLQNWTDNDPKTWDSQLGLMKANGERKPAFQAYRTMVREVDRKPFVGRVRNLGPGTEGVLIYDPANKDYILAAWLIREGGHGGIIARATGAHIRIVTPKGELEGPVARGRAAVDLTDSPRYIHGVDPMVYLPEAGVDLWPHRTIIAPGESAPFRVRVTSLLPGASARVVSVSAPKGLSWDRVKGRVSCGAAATGGLVPLNAKIRVANGPPKDRRTVTLERTALFEVVPTLTLSLRPYLEDGTLVAQATLTNRTARPRREALRLVQEGAGAPRMLATLPDVVLGPNETRQCPIPVPAYVLDALSGPVSWRLTYGTARSKPFRITVCPFSTTGPTVDGILNDWADIPAMTIASREQITHSSGAWAPANASARCRYWLTPDALYFAADVTDNDPLVNNLPPLKMVDADSLVLYIGLHGPTRRTVIDKSFEYQLGLAPTSEGGAPASAFWFHKDVPIGNATVVARKTISGYVLEARIPWSGIEAAGDAPKPGALVGLDVALNDLDRNEWAPAGNTPGRSLVWNGTDSNWIDPSNWGMAIVRQKSVKD